MELRAIQQREANDSERYFPGHGSMANLDYLAICLAGEVGEICGWIKKHRRGSIEHDQMHTELQSELADVLIYLVMMAESLGIDLESAYKLKKAYNDRRYLV